MIKALLKKQALAYAALFVQGKDGKRRSNERVIGFSALMLLALVSMGFIFYEMGEMLCAPLHSQGLDWLYFAFMGTIASGLGAFFSIFTAKSTLYEAKDNDLLLSMPLPAWLILFSRMIGLYLLTLLFEGIVFLPAILSYFVTVGFSLSTLFFSLIVFLLMPLGSLAICCILGWLLALLAAKLPVKNLMTVLLSVAFMVAYFLLYSKVNEYLSYVIANGGVVAAKMKTALFPFWKLGLACTGDWRALALYALLFVGSFALVYLLLSKTYLRLATANRGGRKAKYKGKEGKRSAPFFALFKKEALRYTKNPMLAMNCFLGTIFLLVFPFIALFAGEVKNLLTPWTRETLALFLAAILCVTATMNMISASSVSLEGESVWVVKSLPIPTERVLLAKVAFHLAMTGIPALFACAFMGILFKIGVVYMLAVAAVVLLFSAFCALFGLTINLKMPNLHWTNELAAVKQSASSILSTFAEFAALALLVGGYFLFGNAMFTGGYFLVVIALLSAVSGLLWVWISRRGAKIFEGL